MSINPSSSFYPVSWCAGRLLNQLLKPPLGSSCSISGAAAQQAHVSLSIFAPAAVAPATQPHCGQGSTRGSGWAHVAGSALACAAGGLLTTTALAEARASSSSSKAPSSSSSNSADAGSSGGSGSALSRVKQVLHDAWVEVEEDMSRMNARLPANTPHLRGLEPRVSLGGDGASVDVAIPLRQGANTDAVLSALVGSFSPVPGSSASTSMRSQQMGTTSTVLLEVSDRGSAKTGGGSTLVAQLFIPAASGLERAEVTVTKRWRAGATPDFSQQELDGLVAVLRAANLTFASDGSASQWPSLRRHGLGGAPDELQALMQELESQFFGPLFGGMVMGGLREMMDHMARGGALVGPEAEEEKGEEGSDYSHHGLPGFPGAGAPARPYQQPPMAGRGGRGVTEGADGHEWGSSQAAQAVKQLQSMGAQVYPPGKKDQLDWGVLAGYEDQKRLIEDCLLLPLLRPDVYAQLSKATRASPGTNRPRAVLFEGPPGTGKTTSARVISSQAAVPLVYVPLEAVLSKWYGESEGLLAKVFKAAEALGGAIIFFDELDSLGGSRERGDLHEASRRLLSVLLREMDGFDAANKRAVVIGATNRKEDLDPALLSRFDMAIMFGLPDARCRALILAQYARQLPAEDLATLAARTPGLSGRDLKDVCEHTERRWASKIIRGEVDESSLPTLPEYVASAAERLSTMKQQPRGGPYTHNIFSTSQL